MLREIIRTRIDKETGIRFLEEVVYEKEIGKSEHLPITILDLPEDIKPTDYIYIQYESDFISENNSGGPYTALTITRERPETVDEREIRLAKLANIAKRSRAMRYQDYLKLKKEFENLDSNIIDTEDDNNKEK